MFATATRPVTRRRASVRGTAVQVRRARLDFLPRLDERRECEQNLLVVSQETLVGP